VSSGGTQETGGLEAAHRIGELDPNAAMAIRRERQPAVVTASRAGPAVFQQALGSAASVPVTFGHGVRPRHG
jgi:hypothetical protein